jgi:tripartite-type tricarboxylate transporter receptor subunit TctC
MFALHWLRFAVGFVLALTGFAAFGQAYPSRPITILVSTSPGGTYDTISRVFAGHLERKWKQSVVVENRLGAGGGVALAALTKAPADGYTLTMTSGWIIDLFVKDPGFEAKDIVPVSVAGIAPYVVVVSKNVTAKNLAEFVAHAKANPGKLNWGIVSAGPHEIETADALAVLGIQSATIGYKGIAPIYTALVAGELDATMGTASPQLRSGQLRGLAVGGDKRFSELPDVPTFREQGFKYDPVSHYPFWARTGTPREIVTRLAAEVAEFARSAEFTDKVTKPFAIIGMGAGPEESDRVLKEAYAGAKRTATRLGIKPQ